MSTTRTIQEVVEDMKTSLVFSLGVLNDKLSPIKIID